MIFVKIFNIVKRPILALKFVGCYALTFFKFLFITSFFNLVDYLDYLEIVRFKIWNEISFDFEDNFYDQFTGSGLINPKFDNRVQIYRPMFSRSRAVSPEFSSYNGRLFKADNQFSNFEVDIAKAEYYFDQELYLNTSPIYKYPLRTRYGLFSFGIYNRAFFRFISPLSKTFDLRYNELSSTSTFFRISFVLSFLILFIPFCLIDFISIWLIKCIFSYSFPIFKFLKIKITFFYNFINKFRIFQFLPNIFILPFCTFYTFTYYIYNFIRVFFWFCFFVLLGISRYRFSNPLRKLKVPGPLRKINNILENILIIRAFYIGFRLLLWDFFLIFKIGLIMFIDYVNDIIQLFVATFFALIKCAKDLINFFIFTIIFGIFDYFCDIIDFFLVVCLTIFGVNYRLVYVIIGFTFIYYVFDYFPNVWYTSLASIMILLQIFSAWTTFPIQLFIIFGSIVLLSYSFPAFRRLFFFDIFISQPNYFNSGNVDDTDMDLEDDVEYDLLDDEEEEHEQDEEENSTYKNPFKPEYDDLEDEVLDILYGVPPTTGKERFDVSEGLRASEIISHLHHSTQVLSRSSGLTSSNNIYSWTRMRGRVDKFDKLITNKSNQSFRNKYELLNQNKSIHENTHLGNYNKNLFKILNDSSYEQLFPIVFVRPTDLSYIPLVDEHFSISSALNTRTVSVFDFEIANRNLRLFYSNFCLFYKNQDNFYNPTFNILYTILSFYWSDDYKWKNIIHNNNPKNLSNFRVNTVFDYDQLFSIYDKPLISLLGSSSWGFPDKFNEWFFHLPYYFSVHALFELKRINQYLIRVPALGSEFDLASYYDHSTYSDYNEPFSLTSYRGNRISYHFSPLMSLNPSYSYWSEPAEFLNYSKIVSRNNFEYPQFNPFTINISRVSDDSIISLNSGISKSSFFAVQTKLDFNWLRFLVFNTFSTFSFSKEFYYDRVIPSWIFSNWFMNSTRFIEFQDTFGIWLSANLSFSSTCYKEANDHGSFIFGYRLDDGRDYTDILCRYYLDIFRLIEINSLYESSFEGFYKSFWPTLLVPKPVYEESDADKEFGNNIDNINNNKKKLDDEVVVGSNELDVWNRVVYTDDEFYANNSYLPKLIDDYDGEVLENKSMLEYLEYFGFFYGSDAKFIRLTDKYIRKQNLQLINTISEELKYINRYELKDELLHQVNEAVQINCSKDPAHVFFWAHDYRNFQLKPEAYNIFISPHIFVTIWWLTYAVEFFDYTEQFQDGEEHNAVAPLDRYFPPDDEWLGDIFDNGFEGLLELLKFLI